MTLASFQRSAQKLPDIIVIPGITTATIVASLGIFIFSKRIEVGLGWLITLLVVMLIIENIARTKPYGRSIRLGISLGVLGSWLLVAWLWK